MKENILSEATSKWIDKEKEEWRKNRIIYSAMLLVFSAMALFYELWGLAAFFGLFSFIMFKFSYRIASREWEVPTETLVIDYENNIVLFSGFEGVVEGTKDFSIPFSEILECTSTGSKGSRWLALVTKRGDFHINGYMSNYEEVQEALLEVTRESEGAPVLRRHWVQGVLIGVFIFGTVIAIVAVYAYLTS